MSSSSSSEPRIPYSIVVAPVELTVIDADDRNLLEKLEEVAKKFSMPVNHLVLSGCIKVFKGGPVDLRVRDADVRIG